MTTRRAVLCTVGAQALIALSWPAGAQQQRKVPRIGVLRWGEPEDTSRDTLVTALRMLGHRNGENIAIDWRWATRREDATRHAEELVRQGVDVIVAAATPLAHAARAATTSVPIVLAGVADPVASGLVASLARPGGNVTGRASTNRQSSCSRCSYHTRAAWRTSA